MNGSASDPCAATETNGLKTIETSGQQPSGAPRGSLRNREPVEYTCSFDPSSVGSEHVDESFGENSIGTYSIGKEGTYSIVPGVSTGGSSVGFDSNSIEKNGTYSIVPGVITGGSSVGVHLNAVDNDGTYSIVPGVITGGSSVGSKSNIVEKDGTYSMVPGVTAGGFEVGVELTTVLNAPEVPKFSQVFPLKVIVLQKMERRKVFRFPPKIQTSSHKLADLSSRL